MLQTSTYLPTPKASVSFRFKTCIRAFYLLSANSIRSASLRPATNASVAPSPTLPSPLVSGHLRSSVATSALLAPTTSPIPEMVGGSSNSNGWWIFELECGEAEAES